MKQKQISAIYTKGCCFELECKEGKIFTFLQLSIHKINARMRK